MEERWAEVTGAISQVVADVTTPMWGMSFFPTSNGPYGVTPTQAAIGEAGA